MATLVSGITALQRLIDVDDGPTDLVAGMRLSIDDEILQFERYHVITRRWPWETVPDRWWVLRGIEGTVQASHEAEAEVGLLDLIGEPATPEGPTFLAGSADPTAGDGVEATAPALYAQAAAGATVLWMKVGAGDTDWRTVLESDG